MAMAVAIDTPWVARYAIPEVQGQLDYFGGKGRRFHVHRVSVYAMILPHDSEISRQLRSNPKFTAESDASNDEHFDTVVGKKEALEWQADPDDDQGDAAVLHHLQQQAATVPLLSSVISQRDSGSAVTTLTGSALSSSINARTQGRPLSSFHRHSYRESCLSYGNYGGGRRTIHRLPNLLPFSVENPHILDSFDGIGDPSQFIVWTSPQRTTSFVFWQLQVDVVDLHNRRRPTSRPPKRRRTAFNQFLQVSHSPGVEDTARKIPLPRSKRFNGVRQRTDRNNIWVAEMKPPKHKTKQDFGNFKSEAEAARAVDAAFHHYGRPDLLNFPDTSLQFLFTRPATPSGLDGKAKVKFVREEAKLLLAATDASSPLHSFHNTSLPIRELSASPRRGPSGPFRSFSEISSLFPCSGPDEVDAVVSEPQPRTLHDSICDISSTGVLTNWETLNSVQSAEQRWYLAENSRLLAAPPSASECPSWWLDSILRSSPALTYPRSPSPSPFQEEIAYALLEHQSI